MEIPNEYKKRIFSLVFALIVIIIAFFGVEIASKVSSFDNGSNKTERTIVLSGHGEVSAVPDIANVNFTITKDAKTVKEAQAMVAAVEKSSIDSLKANKVEEKDIKTTNASFYPKYEYRKISTASCFNCGNSVIVGYTASESITVKVRNTDDAGKIMQDLGTLGVSDLTGPNFSIDDEDALKAEARKQAIDEAKQKAEVLAKDLGVRLGKVISFSESGNYPTPVMYKTMGAADVRNETASAQLPKGENIISSDVTVTYEIK